MADQEKRLELLETDLKLVKGEIKRTLVDLRAVVMKAGAPFHEDSSQPRRQPAEADVTREPVARRDEGMPAASPAPQQAQAGPPPGPQPQPVQGPAAQPVGIPAVAVGGAPEGAQAAPDPGRPAARPPAAAEPKEKEHTMDRNGKNSGRKAEEATLFRQRPRPTPQRHQDQGEALYEHNGRSSRNGLQGDVALDLSGMGGTADVNLIGNLMRWVDTAMEWLGQDRMETLLDLYLQSGHDAPGLKELVSHVVRMLGESPEHDRCEMLSWGPAQRANSLLLQLHGILMASEGPPCFSRDQWPDDEDTP